MSGTVLDKFRVAVKQWQGADISKAAKVVAKEFERLNTERTDFVHAYPITNPSGEQVLHRRKDQKHKYFEVDSNFLKDFSGRLKLVSDALYEIRDTVKPEL